MPTYQAPVDDTLFLLNDVFHFDRYGNLPGFADASPDIVEAVLREAGKFAEEVLTPLNRVGDKEGCTRHDDGSVTTPTGFKDAYKQLAEGGWIGMSVPAEFGGQGLPAILTEMVNEYFCSANMAFAMYPGLTQGADRRAAGARLRRHQGEVPAEDGRGRLDRHHEPDRAALRHRPRPVAHQGGEAGDGCYKITGTKIFISAGEHDLSDNIIHLVLARIEGAPEGTKGISLFVVPKIMVGDDGALGERNAVTCGSIEEKMGIHGNATCVMNYDGATGWLIGEENRGLNAMFTMMNEARLGVGIQGLAQSEVAYQNAAAYAKERLQGRAISGVKYPDKPADPIIVHPDVRRTLMTMRAFNEAARALVVWTGLQGDIAHRTDDKKQRQSAEDLMGLLTPVIKGVLTDRGFENTVMAQQIYGGHGYIAEHGMEQFVRDARIAQIYEGANGIQALDLVGRKIGKNAGRALMGFLGEVNGYVKEKSRDKAMKDYVTPLGVAAGHLQEASMWFMKHALMKPDNAGAGATDYMHLFGLVALGYMWARIAEAAIAKLPKANGAAPRMNAKLITARFFMERMLPETALRLARIQAGAGSTMELPDEVF